MFKVYIVLIWSLIYCKIIITTALANTSIPSHIYCFLFVVRTLKMYSLINFQVQAVPDSDGPAYNFYLWWCKRDMHAVETVLRIFSFFPGLELGGTYSLLMPGSGSKLHVPVRHTVTRVNNQCTYSHSVPKQSFCFSF